MVVICMQTDANLDLLDDCKVKPFHGEKYQYLNLVIMLVKKRDRVWHWFGLYTNIYLQL